MITLKMEFQKIRRRKIGLTLFALLAIQFLWIIWISKDPGEKDRAQGWINSLHTLPLLNVITMPTIVSVLASRLSDIEHKGSAYKQLRTLRRPGVLYDAKALCGFLFLFAVSAVQIGFLLLLGYGHAYSGEPDLRRYALAFALSFVCAFSLYLLQLDLSLLFFNQMIPLVAGLCGSLLGLVLMFIKMYSFLPWGGYLSSALVAMDWDREARTVTYYYREYSAVELCAVGMIFVWAAVFYTAGRILFTQKEL